MKTSRSSALQLDLLSAAVMDPRILCADGRLTTATFSPAAAKVFGAISGWLEDGLEGPIPLADLARRAVLSEDQVRPFVDGAIPMRPDVFRFKARLLLREHLIARQHEALGRLGELRLKTGETDPELRAEVLRLEGEISALENADQQNVSAFVRTGAELQQLEIHQEYTVEHLLPSRSITVLHSKGGLGKTHLALGLAQAVSEGQSFLGLETIKRPVLCVDFENPLPMLIERVRRLDVRNVRFWHLSADPRPPKLDGPDWTAYQRVAGPGSLIIFDTLRAAFDGDENSSQDVAVVMGRLKIIRESGFDVLALHHAPKADERRYKGSTAWVDLADQSLDFHRVQSSNLEEIDDEDDAPDCLFSLGTGEKTRFAPWRTFLSFDAAAGRFVSALDPKAALLEQMAEYIRGDGCGQNQTEIVEWAKDGLGVKKRDSVLVLLRRGEGSLWRSHTGFRKARLYEPI